MTDFANTETLLLGTTVNVPTKLLEMAIEKNELHGITNGSFFRIATAVMAGYSVRDAILKFAVSPAVAVENIMKDLREAERQATEDQAASSTNASATVDA